ncbi:serine/threonine-protein kinase [Motilibacter aurantiacus]|uniref:serine/threonine-protein kinase n=1 Tax=Motilibacter aurantiacus TaxID=2714955 RepID=UPI00140B6E5A|nr:serine/threonine-protein kinase [Motilibacter aurantiacus]NHC46668.1 serine/threonine protein kinase [Motilibacter aurantiacus]
MRAPAADGLRELGVVPPGEPLLPGHVVVALLSRGRDLDVYDVWDTARGCRCVVKTLRPDRYADAGARRRLLLEGSLLRRLAHPHLVRAYEVVPGPRPAVVLETLGGATLAAVLDEEGRLAVADTALLGVQLASVLGFLHAAGYLHLDLKPSNVVVEAGRAKLIDLSVARRPGRARRVRGTPGYLAPEQAAGGLVGPGADVWALGALLHECLTGEPAVPEEDVSGASPAGTFPTPAPVAALRRRLPRRLAAVIDGCLADVPEERPPLRDVGRLLAEHAGVDVRAPAADTQPRWSTAAAYAPDG